VSVLLLQAETRIAATPVMRSILFILRKGYKKSKLGKLF
jgi:hypothetical protein